MHDMESKSGSKESTHNKCGNLTYRRKYKNYNHLGQPRLLNEDTSGPLEIERKGLTNDYKMFKTIDRVELDTDGGLYSARGPIFNGPINPISVENWTNSKSSSRIPT